MGIWETLLVNEFDKDFRKGAATTFKQFPEIIRTDAALPRDTGKLGKGIKSERQVIGQGLATAQVRSTARSKGADYGTIIDQATGKIIRPVKKKALANRGSGWGPYASARQSTRHVGWWDKVTSEPNWDRALERGMRPVNL